MSPDELADRVHGADTGTLAAVLWHRRGLGEARRAGDLKIGGSRPAVERFLRLFPASTPAAAWLPASRAF